MGAGLRPLGVCLAALLAATLLSGCELTEITSTAAEDQVVVEGLVRLGLPRPLAEPVSRPERGHLVVTVLLHRTVQGAQGANAPVPGARVDLLLPDGERVRVPEGSLFDCVETTPIEGTGSCYMVRVLEQVPGAGGLDALQPGDRVDLEVQTARGERLTSTTLLPGDFSLVGPAHRSRCVLPPPDTPLPLSWTPSDGAWAYVSETEIRNLPEALAAEGIAVDEVEDPLVLVGLSVGTDDTTIVFPGEFGVFDRFDLDREVAVRLQRGLPALAEARIGVAAVDRNYVNWVRGGNFNPSGQVRVPSVQGEGTGFFGSSVTRWFQGVTWRETGSQVTDCAAPPPG